MAGSGLSTVGLATSLAILFLSLIAQLPTGHADAIISDPHDVTYIYYFDIVFRGNVITTAAWSSDDSVFAFNEVVMPPKTPGDTIQAKDFQIVGSLRGGIDNPALASSSGATVGFLVNLPSASLGFWPPNTAFEVGKFETFNVASPLSYLPSQLARIFNANTRAYLTVNTRGAYRLPGMSDYITCSEVNYPFVFYNSN